MLGIILIGVAIVVGIRLTNALEANTAANLCKVLPPEPPKPPKSLTGMAALRQFMEGGKG